MTREVDEIKNKLDVVDFIGSFITLKKAGRNFKANCPFHNEKTPSFVVSPDRQTWHCFGACKEGGDVIKFLMKWENITFFEALKELAEKTGVKLKNIDFDDQQWKKREKLLTINALAEEFYHFILKNHEFGETARNYLIERGTSEKIIETFKLGYSPESWDSLLNFLKKRGHTQQDIEDTGLLVKSESGRVYDRFRKRIIFPLKDPRGGTIGFSGRLLGDPSTSSGQVGAKYVNTPETLLYHKRETLYGLHITKDMIKKNDQAILVEGEFDMLSCFQHGISNVAAIKGSAVTREQLMLIKRYTKRILLALDSDFSGSETTKRAIQDAEDLDFDVTVAEYDFAKDPDEAIKINLVAFKKTIEKPVPIYDFIIDQSIKKNTGDSVFDKKNIGNEVAPLIASIQNPIVKSHYVQKLSAILDVDTQSVETVLYKETNKQKKIGKPLAALSEKLITISRDELIQKYILSTLFQSADPAEIHATIVSIVQYEDFSTMAYVKILKFFAKLIDKKTTFDEDRKWVKTFTDSLPSELLRVFDEIYLFDISIFDASLETAKLTKLLYELKKIALKRMIKEKMKTNDEESPDSQIITDLTKRLSEVEKKLTIL